MSDDMRRVAEAAFKVSPDNWGVEDPMDCELSIVANPKAPTYDWRFVAHCPLPDEDDHEAFTERGVARLATHIATFDPPTILTLIAAARPAETRDWSEFEDDIADAISDSMDMDWSSRDGARAVVAYLKQIGEKLP